MRELKNLTGIRFLAALYVLVFHVDLRLPLVFLPGAVQALVKRGQLGVTIFFVLSGFVLAYSQLDSANAGKMPSFKQAGYFLFRRLARLYPVYLVGLALSIALSIPLAVLPSKKVLLLYLPMLQVYWPATAMSWYSSGSWSVANEFFFYILFPVLLPGLLRLRRAGWLLGLVLAMSIAGPVLSLLVNSFQPSQVNDLLLYALPPSRLPEFVAGIGCAILAFRFGWQPRLYVVGVLLASTIGYIVWTGARVPNIIGYNWLAVPTIGALLITASLTANAACYRWLQHPWLHYFGKTSYSFYIISLPLLGLLDGILQRHSLVITPAAGLAGMLIICLIAGVLLYEFVERPAHRWALKWLGAGPASTVYASREEVVSST